jgi:hypothetical protein
MIIFLLEMGWWTLKVSYRTARWLFSSSEKNIRERAKYVSPPLAVYSDDSIRLMKLQKNYANRPRRKSI